MTVAAFNQLPEQERKESLAKCCGATAWVEKMMQRFPFTDKASLLKEAEQLWWQCTTTDWLEAFTHHPRIGSREMMAQKFSSTAQWAADEQKGTSQAAAATIDALLLGNKAYEEKFGFIFIVCATGKSATEMLSVLEARLPNEKENETRIAAAEQSKITALRLEKLLA